VEAYHGRLKKFLLLEQKLHSSRIPGLEGVLKIVTAALNAFRPKIFDPNDLEYHRKLADKMLRASMLTRNPLFDRVEKGALSNRGRGWEEVEVDLGSPGAIPDFPRLDEQEIMATITLGPYQLAQAKNYSNEHLNEKGGFLIQVHKWAQDLVRGRIQSRH